MTSYAIRAKAVRLINERRVHLLSTIDQPTRDEQEVLMPPAAVAAVEGDSGWHLTTVVHPLAVALRSYDRVRLSSCTCEAGRHEVYCSHVDAVKLVVAQPTLLLGGHFTESGAARLGTFDEDRS